MRMKSERERIQRRQKTRHFKKAKKQEMRIRWMMKAKSELEKVLKRKQRKKEKRSMRNFEKD